MFFKGSRYAKVPDREWTDPATGRRVRYKGTRFIPDAPPVRALRVQAGDRPDLLAQAAFRDPERFWRLCDANGVLRPAELVREPGQRVGVPAAEG
jgi:hypothetical protein